MKNFDFMELKEQIKYLKHIENITELKESDTDWEIVFKTYARYPSLKKTSEELKKLNKKTMDNKQFSIDVVSWYLNSKNIDEYCVEDDLYSYVQSRFSKGKKRASARW